MVLHLGAGNLLHGRGCMRCSHDLCNNARQACQRQTHRRRLQLQVHSCTASPLLLDSEQLSLFVSISPACAKPPSWTGQPYWKLTGEAEGGRAGKCQRCDKSPTPNRNSPTWSPKPDSVAAHPYRINKQAIAEKELSLSLKTSFDSKSARQEVATALVISDAALQHSV